MWDAHIGGIPVCLIGIESHTVPRRGFVPAGGPSSWSSGTLFPQSSRKLARAINAASGNRPLVVLANLSGFDGSPESMRRWQLEYGAEIGRAVTNFRGPIVFVVVSRYHGGAFVVFSKTAQRAAGDRRRGGLVRVGDRRRAGRCHRVRPRGRSAHPAGSRGTRGGRAGARRRRGPTRARRGPGSPRSPRRSAPRSSAKSPTSSTGSTPSSGRSRWARWTGSSPPRRCGPTSSMPSTGGCQQV